MLTWPQVVVSALLLGHLVKHSALHGKPADDYSLWWALYRIAFWGGLLYWAGFWIGVV